MSASGRRLRERCDKHLALPRMVFGKAEVCHFDGREAGQPDNPVPVAAETAVADAVYFGRIVPADGVLLAHQE